MDPWNLGPGIVPYVTPDNELPGSLYVNSPSAAPATQSGFLRSSWNNVEKFFGLNGKTTADTTGMTPKQATAARTAATVTNVGMLTMAFGAANQAVAGYYSAKSAQYQARSQAADYQYQSAMAAINARSREYDAQSILEAGKSQVQQYTMQAGQEQAATRAETAGRGIQLGQGSAQEVAASQEIVKQLDVNQMSANTVRAAANERMQAAGDRSAAALYQTSAQNALRTAGNISPGMGVLTSLVGSATTFASQWDWRQRLQRQLATPYAGQYYGYGYGGGYQGGFQGGYQ